ncbi:MAG: histidine ammonia-lyase [Deltaproteobacteria bacterium]|nr:histidine ammonia-lyase [Deltaproteobacteria bacterium]
MPILVLDGERLPWEDAARALSEPIHVRLAPAARRRLAKARAVVERHERDERPIYGINTGFGIFARTKIAPEKLRELQRNLVVSHAAGVGAALPDGIVRLMLLLKLHHLARGHSGVRVELAEALAAWLNADCLPIVPAQGSVGASGDLAPLAHLALALLGEGFVRSGGRIMAASRAAKRLRLPCVTLQAKEGLALLNGTEAMLAVAVAVVTEAWVVLCHADIAGALTIEGLLGSVTPFDARLHGVRPHPGAVATAAMLRKLLAQSAIVASHRDCGRVQDPYALRCIPAVHGVAREAIRVGAATVHCELDSVTDNPIIFPDDDAILSGGNFHGAPLAFAMDALAIALTTLASISERRIEQLINPKAAELAVMGLTPTPGLHSGFMVAHTTAAALVSECKTLAHPASVDTIPTWGGQEDHVSMGMWAARKARDVVALARQVVGIELLAACQAIDLHPRRDAPGKGAAAAYRAVRAAVPMLREDRPMAPDLGLAEQLVAEQRIKAAVEGRCGRMPEWQLRAG